MWRLLIVLIVSGIISGLVIRAYPEITLFFIPIFLYAISNDGSGRIRRPKPFAPPPRSYGRNEDK